MKGGGEINYEEPFTDKEKISLLSAFMIFDLKRLLIGNKPLNSTKAWFVFFVSSLVIGFVCYFLVIACECLGSENYTVPYLGDFSGLGVPLLFVALVFAAIGSSFPDTIIFYKDAQKGNYDDAVSNAYGSNIFNLCVALGAPLFLFTIYTGPILLTKEIISLVSSISYWIVGLTIFSIFLYTRNGGITKNKAYVLILSYCVFIIYVFVMAYSSKGLV